MEGHIFGILQYTMYVEKSKFIIHEHISLKCQTSPPPNPWGGGGGARETSEFQAS